MKLAINNQDLAEEFFETTRLLGIMAPMSGYHFCWELNTLLGLDFRINNEIEIDLKKKGRSYFFSVFEFREPAGSLSHYLYDNRFDGEYLLPEFKHMDFLWLMKDDVVTDQKFQQIIEPTKSISGVQLVAELTNERIKNKEHLIF